MNRYDELIAYAHVSSNPWESQMGTAIEKQQATITAQAKLLDNMRSWISIALMDGVEVDHAEIGEDLLKRYTQIGEAE